MMQNSKYQCSMPCGFNSKIYFSLCDLDMQWNGTINKEWPMNTISARFGKTHLVISEMPFEAIVDDARQKFTNHNMNQWLKMR